MNFENQDIRHPLSLGRNQIEFQKKLQESMVNNGINSMILFSPENVFYATGYYREPGGFAISVVNEKGKVHIIVNDLEYESALALCEQDVEVHLFKTWLFVDDGTEASFLPKKAFIDRFAAMKRTLELVDNLNEQTVIGIERGYMNADSWEFLVDTVGVDNLVDNTSTLLESRMIKTSWEIDMLRRAANHCEKLMNGTIEVVKPGMTLGEVEKVMNQKAYELDDDNTVINNILYSSSGYQFGLSGLPRQMVLKEGDMVRLDGGSVHLGYNADIARTFVIGGNPSPEQENIYQALYKGHAEGMKMFKPGTKLADIYKKVRQTIESSGIFPAYARGHVGHSLGIDPDLEEFPQISSDSEMVLKPGMVFSHEVPFYGTRNAQIMTASINIEDTLVITEEGHERFTYANSTLRSGSSK